MSILTRVQINPEIGSNNAAYVGDLITRAKDFIVGFCNLDNFPELSQGYSKSNTNAGTNLTALESNTFKINVNGSGWHDVSINLEACTTGANTATQLQAAIRAVDIDGFDEVSVSFASTQYTLTSGMYGQGAECLVGFDFPSKHVCQALKLSPYYGGTEAPGNEFNQALENVAVALVEMQYRKLGLEGMNSGSLPGGVSFSAEDMPPAILSALLAHRRL